jgi:hypothetical protein
MAGARRCRGKEIQGRLGLISATTNLHDQSVCPKLRRRVRGDASENLLAYLSCSGDRSLHFRREVRSCAGIAQLVEHLICNQRVGGSNPSAGSNVFRARTLLTLRCSFRYGTICRFECIAAKRGTETA